MIKNMDPWIHGSAAGAAARAAAGAVAGAAASAAAAAAVCILSRTSRGGAKRHPLDLRNRYIQQVSGLDKAFLVTFS